VYECDVIVERRESAPADLMADVMVPWLDLVGVMLRVMYCKGFGAEGG
jgi:hypothetical protein